MKFQPMLAHIGELDDLHKSDFIFEPKLDGIRALCYFNNEKECIFISRNNLDVSSYIEPCDLHKIVHARTCILDGEIVVADKKGKTRFELLQKGAKPVIYVIFDILEKDGESLVNLPLLERKKILAATVYGHSHCCRLISYTTEGIKLWRSIKKRFWEGVIAKVKDSYYESGRRSYNWLKIKELDTADCIIVGFISKKRTIASLALGLFDEKGVLHYMGNVGTGFNEEELAELEQRLRKITLEKKPVSESDVPRNITWVRPQFVAEIGYVEVTRQGKFRIPVFKRLRFDKKPRECTMQAQLT